MRALFKEIAESEEKPVYMVFVDAALVEIAKLPPQNDTELLKVSGVGQSKLASYGFEFLN